MSPARVRPRRATPIALVVLLLVSLLAPSVAAATPPAAVTVDDACNGVPDGGFVDVPDSNTFAELIDCLAAYGITQGTGDGSTFDPSRTVRRWEMAVFLARLAAAAAAQLDALTLPEPAETDFTDIDQLSDEAQDAISVLQQVGVVNGTTDTTFSPFDRITRGQMASFVDRLQGAIQAALGGDPDGFGTDEDFFGDDDGTTHEGAINDLASVGIVQGFADGDFGPGRPVTRGQMSAFIMRHVEVNIDAGVLASAFPPIEREVIAEGLANPRHVAVDADGTYVAEAGSGGDTKVDVETPDGSGPLCVGSTGALSEVTDGGATALVQLPSWADSTDDGACPSGGVGTTGPHGVAVDAAGDPVFTIGLGADPTVRPAIADAFAGGELFGTVHRLPDGGDPELLEDLAAVEATDPDGNGPDSNPYGIAIADDGARLEIDAGGNTLLRAAGTDDPAVVAVFAPQCVPYQAPFPNPIPEDDNPCGTSEQFPADAVPTDVAVGPDGDWYVSELGGFPFTPGTARVWKVDADRTEPATCSTFAPVPNDGCEVYATGLTSLVGLDFGADGTLYAAQLADDGVLGLETGGGPATPGSVQVISPGGGTPARSIDDLATPGGVAVEDAGDVLVTTSSISPDAGRLERLLLP